VPNDQVRNLYADGVCKVNIWTSLERDSSPALFEELVRNACRTAGGKTVEKLVAEGLLGSRCLTDEPISLTHCTTTARQEMIYKEMKKIVTAYLEMWYL
jgi:hypothetical protein